MTRSFYEIVALGARYGFAALMLLIVLRAWRITLIDSRRASELRRMSPQTGISGELVVIDGDEKARRGMRYPVIREGMIGASRRADVRIRHSSVRRRHAYFQLTQAGLRVQAHANAPLRDGRGRPARTLTLPDGGEFILGRVRLLLVLAEAPELAKARRPEGHGPERRGAERGDGPDDLFDTDRMFRERPAPRRELRRRPVRPNDADDFFDT